MSIAGRKFNERLPIFPFYASCESARVDALEAAGIEFTADGSFRDGWARLRDEFFFRLDCENIHKVRQLTKNQWRAPWA
jgi:hypothetical protein